MSKRLALLAAAAIAAFSAVATVPAPRANVGEDRDGRRRSDVSVQEHHSERVNVKDHTTLVAAVKAAGLVDTLSGPGPSTVFAPTNAAFAKLPAGTVDTLLKPENKALLTKVLTDHVVPGRMTAASLMKAINEGEGMAKLKTVAGDEIVVRDGGPGKLPITEAKGNVAHVTIANVLQSNGVIHVIDTVLLPM